MLIIHTLEQIKYFIIYKGGKTKCDKLSYST